MRMWQHSYGKGPQKKLSLGNLKVDWLPVYLVVQSRFVNMYKSAVSWLYFPGDILQTLYRG